MTRPTATQPKAAPSDGRSALADGRSALADGPADGRANPGDAPAPKLTRLELAGFKSFASRTVFQFERGITAVVGPNGSGKSNVSDAVRWALGEQSHASLRSKRTEDVIFAGGAGRAPSGMAEVTLTFDNRERWLPSEMAEVAICRRAFRTGENHYLINGRRVRLKDVAQLTSALGQSYTVVGQGLVDQALSQRAEERRGLFEHAADLGGLRLKAAEAERNLAETEANTSRIEDLLTELEPRLRAMERAAKQAREWEGLDARLRTLQRVHYARLLTAATAHLEQVSAAADRERAALDGLQAEVDRLIVDSGSARTDREDAQAALDQHRAGIGATLDQLRRVGHEHDLTSERLAALRRRRDDMAETQTGVDDQLAGVLAEVETVAATLGDAMAAVEAARAARADAEGRATASRDRSTGLDRDASRLGATVADRERRLADLGRRRALLEQRGETDAAERARTEQAMAERATRIERLTADLSAIDQAEGNTGFRLTAIDVGGIELAEQVNLATARAAEARAAVTRGERDLTQAATRLRELRRIAESGAGLHAGVRAVVAASKKGELAGVRGTLAELIAVPAELDTAIEVALGGHLQDLVVDRWEQAERAIALLKKSGAGRATFQPIDTVRPGRDPGEAIRELRGLAGVHGVASELVAVPDELRGIVRALLGRALVVADVDVARGCLPHLPSGWSAVTVGGEVVRTGGSITGGSAIRESGTLGRERDLRGLPAEVAALERRLETTRVDAEAASTEPRRLTEERQRLEGERAALHAARRERGTQRARIGTWLTETTAEQTRGARQVAVGDADATARADERATIDAAIEATTAELRAARTQVDEVSSQLEAARAETGLAETEVVGHQRELATLEERLRAERRRAGSLAAQREALNEERALRGERAATIDGEITGLTAQRDRLGAERARLDETRVATEAARPPLDATLASASGRLAAGERDLETARTALIEAERRRGLSGMDAERIRGEVATLSQRIRDDLDLADPTDLLTDVEPSAEDTDPILRDPEATEREIAKLRERLRRVGYAGETAVEDYEREAERRAFLREQLDDVHGAAKAVSELLVDLRATMRERFDATLAKVGEAFSETFATLFGGGTARLVLVAGEDGERGTGGGVDIVAQPPGKRLQSLALLSGGERALTGAALLFAMLKVNPTPFCLLDEVDAALDEANVVRFREQLRVLASETQAIVITHNRGTIEVADTLYGVTMRDDGVSTVLSLRITDMPVGGSEPPTPADA